MIPHALPRFKHNSKELQAYVYEKEQIPSFWAEFEPFMIKSVEASKGMITLLDIYQMACNGDCTIFATLRDGKIMMVLAARKVDYATYSAARIIAVAGTELKGALKFIDALECWALTQGCVEIEGFCRPSMARLAKWLGWPTKVHLVSRDLRRKLQ